MENIRQFLIENPLIELGLITSVLVLIGYIVKSFKQPVLIGYILGGLLLGPQVFDVIQHYENIEFYSHFGVSLLLFMVGLGLNPKIVKEVGKVSTIAGVGQVLFTSLIGYGTSLLLGFSHIVSLFVAIALTFSSTIVIVKLISDRGDSGTTYGKISLGILIVQDIIAMLILLGISAFTMTGGEQSLAHLLTVVSLEVVGLLLLAWLCAKYILPKILDALAQQKELLLLFIITRAILFGGLRYYAGYSMEIGALLAGVTLASSRYRFHIFSELRPFRDFFLALFFVYLGGQIVFDSVETMLLPIFVFSIFVLIGNPVIVVFLMTRLGYNPKDSFKTGLTVAQISEFSFIVIGLAFTAGIIQDPNVLSLVTIIGLITMTGSSYMFANSDSIYPFVKKFIKPKQTVGSLPEVGENTENRIIIIGYGRLGMYLASKLKAHQIPFCVLENNLKKVTEAEQKGHQVIYGDVSDNDTLSSLIGKKTELIYSTVNNYDINTQILIAIKDQYEDIKVVVIASYVDEAEGLYELSGADYVIFPHMSGAKESREIIHTHTQSPDEFVFSKVKHLDGLRTHKSHIE